MLQPLAPLRYPLEDRLPATGEVLSVAPGVLWLRMMLPFALDHINLWLIEDVSDTGQPGWAVVDAGIALPAVQQAWEQVFAHPALRGWPVLRVIVTHMHPDHLGLADWLCQRWSTPAQACRLWISATDWLMARLARLERTGHGGERTAAFFAQHGIQDEALLHALRTDPNGYARMVPAVPESFRRLEEGLTLRIGAHDWQCIAGRGHAPEHIALHCAALGVLISGDMVLPRISSNVSVIDLEPEADALRWYLDSLDTLRARVPDSAWVLPSHGLPFTGLHGRIAELHAHHAERLDDVRQACAQRPHSAAELLDVLFKRPLDAYQTRFALTEAVAHVNWLWLAGELCPLRGEDGVQRFTLVTSP